MRLNVSANRCEAGPNPASRFLDSTFTQLSGMGERDDAFIHP
jgi:hypothetical protein